MPASDLAPDMLADPAVSRRAVLKGSGAAVALALAGLPLGLAALTDQALAQGGANATAALQLALKLEQLEAAFYAAGYARFRAAGGTVTSAAQRFTPGEDAVIAAIAAHEAAHVALLTAALGAAAPAAPAAFDFSGGGGAGNGPFANAIGTPATASKADFFKLAQLLEDLGVRAYIGQLGALAGAAAADTAARILTVESRHAAAVRTLRNSDITQGSGTAYNVTPWPVYATATSGLYDSAFTTAVGASGRSQANVAAAVYGPVTTRAGNVQAPSAGEDNLVQTSSLATTTLTLPAVSGSGVPSAEAFDEPMTAAAVAAVAAFFGVA